MPLLFEQRRFLELICRAKSGNEHLLVFDRGVKFALLLLQLLKPVCIDMTEVKRRSQKRLFARANRPHFLLGELLELSHHVSILVHHPLHLLYLGLVIGFNSIQLSDMHLFQLPDLLPQLIHSGPFLPEHLLHLHDIPILVEQLRLLPGECQLVLDIRLLLSCHLSLRVPELSLHLGNFCVFLLDDLLQIVYFLL